MLYLVTMEEDIRTNESKNKLTNKVVLFTILDQMNW